MKVCWSRSLRIIGFFFTVVLAPWSGIAASLELHVILWPTGSFVAKTDAVKGGAIVKRGTDQWMAKQIKADLRTLKTGIELRDRHMVDNYFEAGKSNFAIAELVSAEGKGGSFSGKLKVHGETAPISGTYAIQGETLRAEFTTKASLFKIKKAEYMGVGVEDDIKVVAVVPTKSTTAKSKKKGRK